VQLKAILIDPWERSLETIQIKEAHLQSSPSIRAQLEQLYDLVGEEGIGFAYFMLGESIIVGDHSALHDPPLASYEIEGYPHRLYGCGVVIGYGPLGQERETKLSVDDISKIITWYPA
jgi:hypothetical protein